MTHEYERVIAPADALRLHLNENTAGCSPKVLEAIQSLTRHDIATYPDYDAVTAACAARLGVGADRLVLTNGLDDGILATAMAALKHSPRGAAALIRLHDLRDDVEDLRPLARAEQELAMDEIGRAHV